MRNSETLQLVADLSAVLSIWSFHCDIMSDSPIVDATHSPVHSHPRQIPESPSMLLAAPFPTEEVMRALMTTVGDLAATVTSNQAQTDSQAALLTQLMQQQLTTTSAGGGGAGLNSAVSHPVLMSRWRFEAGCVLWASFATRRVCLRMSVFATLCLSLTALR